ncbi:hypothetical protein RBB78_24135 [Tunturiibacter empetritectus]|uniref:hypothetical protein n=1 Tax=Tunturiibacter empetritectus TaxID=3069691 RepID=UPI003D9B791B
MHSATRSFKTRHSATRNFKTRHSAFRDFKTIVSLLTVCAGLSSTGLLAQGAPERTLDEIKVEAVHRAEVGGYPLIGLDPNDVREAFKSIHTRDKDEWAEGFMGVADRYMAEGKSLEKTDPAKANADYIRAWHLYFFGRWPTDSSPKKKSPTPKASKRFLLMPA